MPDKEEFFTGASSPHIRQKISVRSVMGDVLIALLPATVASVYFFGMDAALIVLVSVLSCVASEALWQVTTGRKITIGDLSAVVTGLLLAFNLPVSVPLWLPAVGGVFAIVVVKQFYGGMGQNIVNPALAARALLLASWPVQMTNWTVDGVSAATALDVLKRGSEAGALPSFLDVFIGSTGGCLGETSALALILGGGYLLLRRIITWHIPAVYIGTVFVLTLFLGRDGFFMGNGLYEICAGGLMIGAFFMATDYTTSPMTSAGKIVFAAGCGVLTTVIRLYGGYAEGVSYSILIMNLFVPVIDRYVIPRPFGEERR